MGIGGWILVVVVGAVVVFAAVTIHRYRIVLQLRGREPQLDDVSLTPAHLEPSRAALDQALGELGFAPEGVLYGHLPDTWGEDHFFPYRSPDGGAAWARITPGQPGRMVVFLSAFDDGSVVETHQSSDLPVVPDREYLSRELKIGVALADALDEHRLAVRAHEAGGRSLRVQSSAETVRAAAQLAWRAWLDAERDSIAYRAADGHLALRLLGARDALRRLSKPLLDAQRSQTKPRVDGLPEPAELAAVGHANMRSVRDRGDSRVFAWIVFLLSAVAFTAAALGLWGGFAGALMATLLFHELGHWAAMRAFGYRDTRIFFIPLFGAGAVGRREDPKLWQEMVVLLAGPMPGLFLGAGLLFVPVEWVAALGATMVVVNAFNLLPLLPLDGGRAVHRLLPVGSPWVDLGMRATATVAFGIVGFAFNEYLLIGLAFALGFSLRQSWRISGIVRQLRAEGVQSLPEGERLVRVHRAILEDPRLGKQTYSLRYNVARDLLERVRLTDASSLARGLAAGLGCLGVAFVVVCAGVPLMLWAGLDRTEIDLGTVRCEGGSAPAGALSVELPDGPFVATYYCAEPTDEYRQLADQWLTFACQPAPWDPPPDDATMRARQTMRRIREGAPPPSTPFDAALEVQRERVAELDTDANDPEVLRLYLAALDGDQDARDALGRRIGAFTCVDGTARVTGGWDVELSVMHDGLPPVTVIDALCAVGCREVGGFVFPIQP